LHCFPVVAVVLLLLTPLLFAPAVFRLGEEEKKAAQAARQAREMEHKKASVGSTLSMLGIGPKGFSSMTKQPTRTGGQGKGTGAYGGGEARGQMWLLLWGATVKFLVGLPAC
jgi:hypothetical protein